MSVLKLPLEVLQLHGLEAAPAPAELRAVVITEGPRPLLPLCVPVAGHAAGAVTQLEAGWGAQLRPEASGARRLEEAGHEAGVWLTLPQVSGGRAEAGT